MEAKTNTPEFIQLVEELKARMGTRYLLHPSNRVVRLDGKDYRNKVSKPPRLRKVG